MERSRGSVLFERAIVINLESRRDRLEQVTSELNELGVPFEVFKGIEDKESGARGVFQTYKALLESLKAEGETRNVLILEDDVVFAHDAVSFFHDAAEGLKNKSWDLLFLGANVHKRMIATDTLYLLKLQEAYALHAVVYSEKGRNKCLELLSKHEYSKQQPIDTLYAKELIPRGDCYIINPMLAFQRPSFSDIERRHVDYTGMLQHKFKINQPW